MSERFEETFLVLHETERAVLVAEREGMGGVWLPRAQVEVTHLNRTHRVGGRPLVEIGMSLELADEKGLTGGGSPLDQASLFPEGA